MSKNYFFSKMALAMALCLGCAGVSAQTTFSYTGSVQTYTVGTGITNVCIDAYGASGGTSVSGAVDSGGKGARVECNLAVTPGQVLYIYVGGVGGDGSFSVFATGGYNGGGNATYYVGSGGGGATDVRTGGTALSNRIVVAGGGGGAGVGTMPVNGYERGGGGGGVTGENGYYGNVTTGAQGGGGGTASAGGAGGVGTGTGQPGTLGNGGAGNSTSYGGGGGGGLYGGGGGIFSGGGGGSSYVDGSLASYTYHTSGYNRGNGKVVISTGCLSSIGGSSAPLCISTSTTLTNDYASGVWSSASGAATIGASTGVVTGVSAGTTVISYTDGPHTVTKTITVTTCPSLGVQSVEAAKTGVYPNPASDRLTITADVSVCSTIMITNSMGQQIMQIPVNAATTEINVAPLPAGLYYVRFTGTGSSIVQKFMKL